MTLDNEALSSMSTKHGFTSKKATALNSAKGLWQKLLPVLPWISIIYGVASGFIIDRDYQKSPRLLLFGVGTILLIILITQLDRIRESGLNSQNEKWQRHIPSLLFAGNWLTQSFVQYISLFVLPLTVFNESYLHMAVASLCAFVSIVDRCWLRAATWPLFLPSIRAISGYFALSFSLPVLAPKLLPYYATIVDVTVILLFIPWSKLEQWWDLGWRRRLLWLLFISIPLSNLFIPTLPKPILLSVWVKDLKLGFNITDHTLNETLRDSVSRSDLTAHLIKGDKLCCHTPIMGPVGIEPRLVHAWYANGLLIDRIQLGRVTGQASLNESGFRTFSCKSTFPNLATISSLRCRVLLGQGVIIGEGELGIY